MRGVHKLMAMNDQVRKLYEQARQLSVEEQQELAELLNAGAIAQSDIDAAWLAELEDRLRSLDDGTAKLVPVAQVLGKNLS